MVDISKIGKEVELESIVGNLVKSQEDSTFPEAKDISVSEAYRDPFAFPRGCDLELFAYAWVDLSDDLQRMDALNNQHYLLVTRSNHSKISHREFALSGAVVRRGMALMYRPVDIERVMREAPMKQHLASKRGSAEGQRLGSSAFIDPVREEDAGNVKVTTAFEEAGSSGLTYVDSGGQKE